MFSQDQYEMLLRLSLSSPGQQKLSPTPQITWGANLPTTPAATPAAGLPQSLQDELNKMGIPPSLRDPQIGCRLSGSSAESSSCSSSSLSSTPQRPSHTPSYYPHYVVGEMVVKPHSSSYQSTQSATITHRSQDQKYRNQKHRHRQANHTDLIQQQDNPFPFYSRAQIAKMRKSQRTILEGGMAKHLHAGELAARQEYQNQINCQKKLDGRHPLEGELHCNPNASAFTPSKSRNSTGVESSSDSGSRRSGNQNALVYEDELSPQPGVLVPTPEFGGSQPQVLMELRADGPLPSPLQLPPPAMPSDKNEGPPLATAGYLHRLGIPQARFPQPHQNLVAGRGESEGKQGVDPLGKKEEGRDSQGSNSSGRTSGSSNFLTATDAGTHTTTETSTSRNSTTSSLNGLYSAVNFLGDPYPSSTGVADGVFDETSLLEDCAIHIDSADHRSVSANVHGGNEEEEDAKTIEGDGAATPPAVDVSCSPRETPSSDDDDQNEEEDDDWCSSVASEVAPLPQYHCPLQEECLLNEMIPKSHHPLRHARLNNSATTLLDSRAPTLYQELKGVSRGERGIFFNTHQRSRYFQPTSLAWVFQIHRGFQSDVAHPLQYIVRQSPISGEDALFKSLLHQCTPSLLTSAGYPAAESYTSVVASAADPFALSPAPPTAGGGEGVCQGPAASRVSQVTLTNTMATPSSVLSYLHSQINMIGLRDGKGGGTEQNLVPPPSSSSIQHADNGSNAERDIVSEDSKNNSSISSSSSSEVVVVTAGGEAPELDKTNTNNGRPLPPPAGWVHPTTRTKLKEVKDFTSMPLSLEVGDTFSMFRSDCRLNPMTKSYTVGATVEEVKVLWQRTVAAVAVFNHRFTETALGGRCHHTRYTVNNLPVAGCFVIRCESSQFLIGVSSVCPDSNERLGDFLFSWSNSLEPARRMACGCNQRCLLMMQCQRARLEVQWESCSDRIRVGAVVPRFKIKFYTDSCLPLNAPFPYSHAGHLGMRVLKVRPFGGTLNGTTAIDFHPDRQRGGQTEATSRGERCLIAYIEDLRFLTEAGEEHQLVFETVVAPAYQPFVEPLIVFLKPFLVLE